MDSLITSAAHALVHGDFFGALNRVAVRDDPPALALRGIAMAQLGELESAKLLLRKAAAAFGPKQAMSQTRCMVAEAEIALAIRELDGLSDRLDIAQKILEMHGDLTNASYAQHLKIRLLVLLGHLPEAEILIDQQNPQYFSPAFKAAHELVVAGIAIRRLRIKTARAALTRARDAARATQALSLSIEIDKAFQILQTPAARLVAPVGDRLLLLEDVESLLASDALVVDACHYVVRHHETRLSLAGRPILFTLAQVLAEAWPEDVTRDQLIKRAFRHTLVDESLRARLRVEISRLRTALSSVAEIEASPNGFKLVLLQAENLVVLDQPVREKHAAIIAILADGEAWSSSALAMVLGVSQRTIQRALDALAAAGKVQSFGRGQARRWVSFPLPGITTILLLPGRLPGS